jgi:hypothetical protein
VLDTRPITKDRQPDPTQRRFGKWYICLVCVALGLLAAGGMVLRHNRPAPMDPRLEMIQAGQMMVRDSLPEGLRAAFAGEEETQVDSLPENKFLISGWVDLVTAEGRHDRQTYSVIVYRGDQKSWVGERLSVLPQM